MSQQTFYYAVKLDDGKILRLAKTTDSVFHTLMGSLIWLGLLMIVNHPDRNHFGTEADKKADQTHKQPGSGASSFDNVCYEELKPLAYPCRPAEPADCMSA